MVKLMILIALLGSIGTVTAFGEEEPGYPIPAPPAMFYDTSVTADASGVTSLSIYFEGDGRAKWDTEPLVSYLIALSGGGYNTPVFTFEEIKPVEKDYQVRFTALSVVVGDIVLPVDYDETDLYEGGLTTANVIKDGGVVAFIPTKVTLPDTLTLEMQYEAEYMGDSVYRVFAQGMMEIDFPAAIIK